MQESGLKVGKNVGWEKKLPWANNKEQTQNLSQQAKEL